MDCIMCGRKFGLIHAYCRKCGFPAELSSALKRHLVDDKDLNSREFKLQDLEKLLISLSAFSNEKQQQIRKQREGDSVVYD